MSQLWNALSFKFFHNTDNCFTIGTSTLHCNSCLIHVSLPTKQSMIQIFYDTWLNKHTINCSYHAPIEKNCSLSKMTREIWRFLQTLQKILKISMKNWLKQYSVHSKNRMTLSGQFFKLIFHNIFNNWRSLSRFF